MVLNKSLFTSDKQYWETPQAFFDKINAKLHFSFDLAASDTNHKCKHYFTEKDDALKQEWHKIKGNLWLNPPYGRTLKLWVKKAYEESLLKNGGGGHCFINPIKNRYKLLA